MSIERSKFNPTLKQLSNLIEPIIDSVLTSHLEKKNHFLFKYQVKTGGKKLRPALAIISCKLLGGKLKDVLYPAAGLEILHNYTLIIDDIVDNSNLRREKPTLWFKFGNSIAQCVSIGYSASVFQTINNSKNPKKIAEILAKAMKAISDGQILDILFEQGGREKESYVVKNRYKSITKNDYFKMIGKKTAYLFQACCEIGAVSASASEKQIAALKDYGFNLGIAFQIQDDILDIFGSEEKFGKKIGKDIIEKKLGNTIIFFALKELNDKGKQKILGIMRKKHIKNKDIKEAIKLINQTKSRQKARQLAEEFIEKAKRNLNFLPKNKWNNILREIANFTLKREI